MTEDEFWEIVDGCRRASGGEFGEQVRLQREQLSQLGVDELLSFREHWDAANDVAFDWGVWDAAAFLLGGCGDDSFGDFRAWLIGHGRAVLEQVAVDPDALADIADEWTESTHRAAEEFGALVFSIYEEKTGSCDMPVPEQQGPYGPSGEQGRMTTRALAYANYPRMAERYYGPAGLQK